MRFRAFSPKQKQVLTWWCDPAARSRRAASTPEIPDI